MGLSVSLVYCSCSLRTGPWQCWAGNPEPFGNTGPDTVTKGANNDVQHVCHFPALVSHAAAATTTKVLLSTVACVHVPLCLWILVCVIELQRVGVPSQRHGNKVN